MSRFYFPENRFRIRNDGATLAFFTFYDNDTGLEYQDWKLMDGRNGIFAAGPSGKPYIPKGEQKQVYPNLIQASYDADAKNKRNVKGVAYLKELSEAAYAKYCDLNGTGAEGPKKQKSARGPVPAAVGPDDDLPF